MDWTKSCSGNIIKDGRCGHNGLYHLVCQRSRYISNISIYVNSYCSRSSKASSYDPEKHKRIFRGLTYHSRTTAQKIGLRLSSML